MVNITGTSSIRHDAPMTLTDISESFKTGGDNQHIRFSEAKGLHTHSKYGSSTMDFLAFFKNPEALRQRAEMRAQGASQVQQAIDNEFGKGMGARVFAALDLDPTRGLTLGDIHRMQEVAGRMLQDDLDVVRTMVGAKDIYQFFLQSHDKLGMSSGSDIYKNYDVQETDTVLGRMAAAVLPFMNRAMPSECARVAVGEIIKYNLLRQNERSENPFTEAQREQFDRLMLSCFHPSGENVGFKPEIVFAALAGHCVRGTLPTSLELRESLQNRSIVG